jgi:hypothetical protein
MRIVPFPDQSGPAPEDGWLEQLDDALAGNGAGPDAAVWRELRADVRALAPAMTPEFERRLGERIAEGGPARRRAMPPQRGWLRSAGTSAPRAASPAPSSSRGRARWSPRRLVPSAHPGAAAGVAVAMLALLAALLIVGPLRSGNALHSSEKASPMDVQRSATVRSQNAQGSVENSLEPFARAVQPATQASGEAAASGSTAGGTSPRVQELAASTTLAATPENVQATADRVSELTTSAGGFVQSSHVQVQQGGSSEATLTLRLPSAKLAASLAALSRVAPVRAQSQSLQDITNASEAARRRLADALAERRALLRELAGAESEGKIDSLREQLATLRSTIIRARAGVQAVSQRAESAQVEVTVLGDQRAGGGALSFDRGLNDAGRVLIGVAVVLLIAAAALLPLAFALIAATLARRAWLRARRERALDLG